MLSETCKNVIVDLLNQQVVTVSGKTLRPTSIRDSEFTPAPNEKSPEEPPARVVVDFPITSKRTGYMSDIINFDNVTGVATFGVEEVSEVDIKIACKEVPKGKITINANTIAQAILSKIDSVLKKQLPFLMKTYHAGFDGKKGFSYRDNSRFVAADKRSELMMRFFLKHQASWDSTTEEVTTFGPPSYQINFKLDDEDQYTHVVNIPGD